jgi:HEAT repeat protein
MMRSMACRNRTLRRVPWIPALSMGLVAALSGCQQGQQSDRPWSTRDRSVLAMDEPSLVDTDPAVTTPLVPVAAPDLRTSAEAMLREGARSSSPLIRANAIEALEAEPLILAELVPAALVDENRGVRFVAAMSIGRTRMQSLSHLLEPLQRDPSESVRAAAIYGLTKCGRPVDPTPLAQMIRSEDPEVRGNALFILGELGNRSAAPMIRDSLGRGLALVHPQRVQVIELQAAEALVKLGQTHQVEPIRAKLFAPPEESEITALACQICGRLRDERSRTSLLSLATGSGPLRRPAEVRLAAVGALASIGAAPPEARAIALEYTGNDLPAIRAQAALVLGDLGDASDLATLSQLIGDGNQMVQIAAARSILVLG